VAYLIDTSILARLANSADAFHAPPTRAVFELHRLGQPLHLSAQTLIEFHGVATRPVSANGLGLDTATALAKAASFESAFPLLPDTPSVYAAWRALVSRLSVTGKQVHDARLVAFCQVHGLPHLLTFNSSHFLRLASTTPGLSVKTPADIVAGA
jgi:predicted nucleic acid-binding protein